MILEEDVYKIGYLGKTHGLHGELTFHFTDDIFDICDSDYILLRIDGIIVPFFFDSYRFSSDSCAIVKFMDIDDIDHAQRLVGCDVLFERRHRREVDDSDLPLSYLIGFDVLDSSGTPIGKIIDIDTQTDNNLLLVESSSGRIHYLPIHDDLILSIDDDTKSMTMDVPLGLLEI
mgnify:CR=1 FL=1